MRWLLNPREKPSLHARTLGFDDGLGDVAPSELSEARWRWIVAPYACVAASVALVLALGVLPIPPISRIMAECLMLFSR